MRTVALLAISAYQRYVSPRKGFCCAYREWTGAKSCSVLGQRVIRRFGLVTGMVLLRRRFEKCAAAAIRMRSIRSQQGIIDCACDIPTCDIPACDLPSCDWLDCPSCDCGSWRRDKRDQESVKEIYIPPGKWGADSDRSTKVNAGAAIIGARRE